THKKLCPKPTKCGFVCHGIDICYNNKVQHAEDMQQMVLVEGVLPLDLHAVRPGEDVEILVSVIILSLDASILSL
ncbi:hypothetical protein, partial [Salmonella sp. gx-f5]|uniref:hypothetical protein n=1 Tax=Salmonella sp. gx-f5 TaxID=2582605 RepID=UPI001F32057A